jgi:hypothetical protein
VNSKLSQSAADGRCGESKLLADQIHRQSLLDVEFAQLAFGDCCSSAHARPAHDSRRRLGAMTVNVQSFIQVIPSPSTRIDVEIADRLHSLPPPKSLKSFDVY